MATSRIEICLHSSIFIKHHHFVVVFGSDGTDGPTDAAGGYVDGKTSRLVDIDAALQASDSYHALQKSGGLLVTGPTGTNVNDLAVVLIN